ncbi:MAG: phage terminase large subunit [Rikenellaceae bacterium]
MSQLNHDEHITITSFAQQLCPFIEMESFHTIYYRVLEEFARGKIKRLIVTMPPQHGKSLASTTLLPAYMLGLNPDMRIAIASYSASLAGKFNRRVQRLIESCEYEEIFPQTTIKKGGKPATYLRTAEEVEIIGHEGSLLAVGREGSLTGNRVDCFILDDLYKDAMEANSPTIRENCLEWYTSVVRTRTHNASQELIVFTRWHEEDLIGTICAKESYTMLTEWSQIEEHSGNGWLYLNFEAIMSGDKSELDTREKGEALWPTRQNRELLLEKRSLDPLRFECMYQGHPSSREGLLYGSSIKCYSSLPNKIHRIASYTDTADTGDDYLCSVAYVVDSEGIIYVTDVVYTREPMEISEPLVASMLLDNRVSVAYIESNNGGRGFARAVQRLAPGVKIEWFYQSANKEARILSNSATLIHTLRMPEGWSSRWPELYAHMTTYRRLFRSNRWHDAPDTLTGVVERETTKRGSSSSRMRFL